MLRSGAAIRLRGLKAGYMPATQVPSVGGEGTSPANGRDRQLCAHAGRPDIDCAQDSSMTYSPKDSNVERNR